MYTFWRNEVCSCTFTFEACSFAFTKTSSVLKKVFFDLGFRYGEKTIGLRW